MWFLYKREGLKLQKTSRGHSRAADGTFLLWLGRSPLTCIPLPAIVLGPWGPRLGWCCHVSPLCSHLQWVPVFCQPEKELNLTNKGGTRWGRGKVRSTQVLLNTCGASWLSQVKVSLNLCFLPLFFFPFFFLKALALLELLLFWCRRH